MLTALNEEVNALKDDQDQFKKLAGKEDLHHDEIQKILKSLPEFEKRKADVLIHLDLAQKVTENMQDPKFNVMDLVEFEQTIISGVNAQGKPVTDTFVAKELTKILKTLGRPQDKLRLLGMYV